MLVRHKFISSCQGVLRNPWKRKQEIRRKQKTQLAVCHTYHPHCFYAYHRFLSLFGSEKPVSSSSPHLPEHPQRNHGCCCLLSHWNHLLKNCSCCREREDENYNPYCMEFSGWMPPGILSIPEIWHQKLMFWESFPILCQSLSQTSVSSLFYQRKAEGVEKQR